MTFVDPLAVMLIGLAMGTAIGAFYFFFAARGDKEQIKALAIPAVGIGIFNFISGFYMSFGWIMTGFAIPYNMLFGDPLLLFGLLMIIAGVVIYKDMHLGMLPILGLVLGIYVLDAAYTILTVPNYLSHGALESGNDLITAMGLYLFDGIGAILAPIAYLKPQANSTNKYLYYLEWIILGIGTVFALVIGVTALNGHVASPP
jgi:putative membrane protein